MRSRSLRISITIILIFGVAIAALGFKDINIDIPGIPRIERESNGPLGLKLGLDLRGGGHLVYQADTGTKFEVTFADEIDVDDFIVALESTRFGEEELELEGLQFAPLGPRQFQIRTNILAEDDPRHTGLQSALAESLGTITLFESSVIEKPTQDQMEGVLDNITNRVNRFGTEEPIIQIFGEDRLIVQLPGASGSITDIVLAESGEEADPDAARKNVDVFVDLPRVLTESG